MFTYRCFTPSFLGVGEIHHLISHHHHHHLCSRLRFRHFLFCSNPFRICFSRCSVICNPFICSLQSKETRKYCRYYLLPCYYWLFFNLYVHTYNVSLFLFWKGCGFISTPHCLTSSNCRITCQMMSCYDVDWAVNVNGSLLFVLSWCDGAHLLSILQHFHLHFRSSYNSTNQCKAILAVKMSIEKLLPNASIEILNLFVVFRNHFYVIIVIFIIRIHSQWVLFLVVVLFQSLLYFKSTGNRMAASVENNTF